MSRKRHSQQQTHSETKETKPKAEIVIAVIGLIGTIVAALLASPLIEKWGKNIETPTEIVVVPTIQVTDTQVVVQEFTPVIGPGDTVDAKGIVMVFVPAGKFTMGTNNGDDDEKPPHEVYLDAYYIDKYEVTNSLYKVCVDSDQCKLPSDVRRYDDSLYANHPVVYVSWEMAETYCSWRGLGTRLPTEAEWEKAARGTDDRLYPWGDTASCEQANYGNCVGDTVDVGKYKNGTSPFGVYDMAGNVWEWVSDWYLSDYYKILESNSLNPQGPTTGEYKVYRGGDWNDSSYWLRVSLRNYDNSTPYSNVGFRCARPETISATATAAVTLTASAAELNLPSNIVDDKKVAMVLVPTGEYTMGTDNEDANWYEKPAHQVYLKSFYIDKYEVTNALYKICVDVGICDPPTTMGSQTRESYFDNTEFKDYPVIGVTWNMARNYCEWRDARLPTEAEWEKAARGKDQHIFPWGDNIDESFTNYNLYIGDTTAVGSYDKDKSFYNVYDMAGNVAEWVADWYSAGYYKAAPYENPQGPELGKDRSVRGGSYYDTKDYAMIFHRSNQNPEKSFYNHGFRCVKDVSP